jgi:hypothetical protein
MIRRMSQTTCHRGHLLEPLAMQVIEGGVECLLVLPANTLVQVYTSEDWQNDIQQSDIREAVYCIRRYQVEGEADG